MHSAINDILRELPFYGINLPLPCPIPAYWMCHPDHLDFMRHPNQFSNGYASNGCFIGEATESWGRSVVCELPFYGVDLPLFAYELHRTSPGQHDFDLSIEGTFQVRRKNYGVLYDVLDGGSWALRELPFYGVDLPLFTYELHCTGPGEHDFDLSIERTFQVRHKNCWVLYDVLALSSGKRTNFQSRGVLHTFQ
ncbi:hypothetical protein B0H16DRAFT_1472375 [Mycena metata]|uniref:Uncharacterized protein n=1 Tax=Mycena metata TaxID=1033252 RepID=A0AAD7HPE5_9AGAR|nr:hypothetical protein B0H16DRAFT_1472375 [Mycena metata]